MALSDEAVEYPKGGRGSNIKKLYPEDKLKESIRRFQIKLNFMWKDIANFKKHTNKIIKDEFGDGLLVNSAQEKKNG